MTLQFIAFRRRVVAQGKAQVNGKNYYIETKKMSLEKQTSFATA